MSSFDLRNPGLHDLIAADVRIERVAGGLGFTEGPVWRDNALLFSDLSWKFALARYHSTREFDLQDQSPIYGSFTISRSL